MPARRITYRPGIGWWPKDPPASGGGVLWDSSLMKDWHGGGYIKKPTPTQWKEYTKASATTIDEPIFIWTPTPMCIGYKKKRVQHWDPYKAWPGMRNSKRLRSTQHLKVCQGGPWDGARVRRTTPLDRTPRSARGTRGSSKVVTLVPAMPDTFTVTPWLGRYQWDSNQDRYLWITPHQLVRPTENPSHRKPSVTRDFSSHDLPGG